MSLSAGTRLGPYEILCAIGAGGMGEVYRARDTRLDRTVAVKVLPSHVSGDPALRERFEREARTVAALNHPHICTLHDVGHQDGIDFLVMEHLEGETLAARLAKGALPLDQALRYAIEIADALDKAHRAGIVHRDLKPGNIMLVRRGGPSGPPVAKLLDFGLAKVTPAVVAASGLSVAPTLQTPVTIQGTILGTLQYMAPEQIEGQEADARTDIFAFGCVLYEMLTGRKAFEGKTQASLIGAILKDVPPPISNLQPLTPASLDRIVTTCLAKDPDDRWQTARDLLRELQWSTESAAAIAAPAAAHGRSSLRVWMTAGAASCAAALLIAFGAWLYVRSAVPPLVITRLDVVTPPTNDAYSFAISPDGRQLAFVANGEKGSQLWVRPLDQITAQPLTGTDGAKFPFWAPDGHAIGFFADGKLKRIDLPGGAPQVLADVPQGRGGTWNSDGVIVFGQASPGALMRVMATGGTPVPVTRVAPGQSSHRFPQFLPDGRRVLFSMAAGRQETLGVYVVSLDGGEPTRVLPAETAAAYAPAGYLLQVRQGVLLAQGFDPVHATLAGEPIPLAQSVGTDDGFFHSAFSVSATGVLAYRAGEATRRQLVWVDRAGKVLAAIGSRDENALGDPELDSDGQRVAVMRTVSGNADVWLINVSRALASRFTFDATIDSDPVWSPDGTQVVFRSGRNGVYDLFEKSAAGASDERPLLVNAQSKGPLDWSRDGRVLLYSVQDLKNGSDLWALPMTGDRKPFPVVQGIFDEIEGQFSPDGRWLAYTSNESGPYEIYVRPFPGTGGKWQMSTAGGRQPRWSRDGRELFYVTLDNSLMAVPIRVASGAQTLDAGAPVALFSSRLASGANVFSAGFGAKAQYAVAADGRFLMNVTADDAVASPITVVLNWDAALKK